MDPREIVTQLLRSVAGKDGEAVNRLLPLVYDELRKLANRQLSRERCDHTLQPTALVHEAYLQLVEGTEVDWKNRTHFLAVAATAMRRILIQHARTKAADKRGGGFERVVLDESVVEAPRKEFDLLALDQALRSLEQTHPQQSRLVELRFFGGLTMKECATALGAPLRTLEREWILACARLGRALAP